MRIRFNIYPFGDVELALMALLKGYPDGFLSELVRRLIVSGFCYHSTDEDILQDINLHQSTNMEGIECKFNVSPNVPKHDPVVLAYNKAKSLNALVKPLYLNKLLKTGYLIESGRIAELVIAKKEAVTNPTVSEPKSTVPKEITESSVPKVEITPSMKANTVSTAPNLSLKDNPDLRNSLKGLAS